MSNSQRYATEGGASVINDWIETMRADGFDPFPAAVRALQLYGGLCLDDTGPGRDVARERFAIDPTTALGERDRFEAFEASLGGHLYPLGEAGGGQYFLAVTEGGKVYGLTDEAFLIGHSVDDAIQNLARGERPGEEDAEQDLIQPDWTRAEHVRPIVSRLYELVAELETIFPGRHFTPDGHLLGSIGEALAAYAFGLTLNRASTAAHDATVGRHTVEVKATQRDAVSFYPSDVEPDFLVVLLVKPDARAHVVFNGPARLAWELAGRPQKNGQRRVSLRKLRKLDATLTPADRLPQIRSLDF